MAEAKPKKATEKEDPVYVATGSFDYRFADGTEIRLTDGVSPQVEPGQLRELKRYGYVKEVK